MTKVGFLYAQALPLVEECFLLLAAGLFIAGASITSGSARRPSPAGDSFRRGPKVNRFQSVDRARTFSGLRVVIGGRAG